MDSRFSLNRSQFGAVFGATHAVELILSTSFRSGTPVCPDEVADIVLAQFPDCGMSRDQIQADAREAARRAGVTLIERRADPAQRIPGEDSRAALVLQPPAS